MGADRRSVVEPYINPRREARVGLERALLEARNQGVPQWAVAKEAGIHPATLTNIMRGRENVTIEVAQRISDALGRSRDRLFEQFRGMPRP